MFVSQNALTSLPDDFGLRLIAFPSSCSGRLSSLSELELAHNKIAVFPSSFQYLRSLVRLDLRHNAIKEVPYLGLASFVLLHFLL